MNSTKLFLLLLTHLFVCQIYSQTDFTKVDQYARDTPSSQTQSIEKLAAHLTSKFKTETESVRAIYVWMAENIRYNHRVINNENISIEQRLKKEKPEKVLKAKWAVCEGYSNLFYALCQEAGIACEVVTGIVKDQNGKIPAIGHAWNVVRVDGQWHPIDVTWGAGGLSGDNNKFVKNFKDDFFLTDPAVFIHNHYPHDPLFQLLETPYSLEEFRKKDFPQNANSDAHLPTYQNITDSLNYFTDLEGDAKTLNRCFRILKFNPSDGYANDKIASIHYAKARSVWEIYQAESKEVFEKKKPLTWESVERWEKLIAEFRSELDKTEFYLENIQKGDRHEMNKKTILSSLKENRKIDPTIDKQFEEYRKYLTAMGHSKK